MQKYEVTLTAARGGTCAFSSPDERTRVLWTTSAFPYASLGHDTYVSGPDYLMALCIQKPAFQLPTLSL